MKKVLLLMVLMLTTSISARGNSYLKYKEFILKQEIQASPNAKSVMQVTRHMVENHIVIVGSCWDYLDAAFTEAGYSGGRRTIIYKGKKNSGPYAAANKIESGDWLYYVNHSYHDVEHSGLFIGWTNYKKRLGLIMSYAGQSRGEPARYKVYNLSHVYHIIRAK